MTDKETLDRAIKLAIDGGFSPSQWYKDIATLPQDQLAMYLITVRRVEQLIFNHDFAKALWGKESGYELGDVKLLDYSHDDDAQVRSIELCEGFYGDTTKVNMPAYLRHLMCMVISPDPIAYLRQNMPSK